MDLTAGKRFDRVSMTWLDPEEWQRRHDEYSERAFQRGARQGELAAPMIITDGMTPFMSMTNGQMYDSKSAVRAEYKKAGVVEVGNDVPMKKAAPSRDERDRARKARQASIGKALSYHGFGA